MRTSLAFIALLFLALTAGADAVPVGVGRHFIIAFPDTLRHLTVQSPFEGKAQIVIFAQQRTSVTVSGPGVSRTVIVDSSRSTTIDIPSTSATYLDRPDVPLRRTFELVADGEILVQAFFVTSFGAEAFAPLPVEQWGNEYFVACARPSTIADVNYIGNEERPILRFAPAQFAVIAAQNGTRVTLSGPISRTIDLDEGEAYLVEPTAANASTTDPIGTRVVATGPIAVIAGGTRSTSAWGGLTGSIRAATGNTYQNVTIDWLAPTTMHGTLFFYDPVMRQNGIAAGELIRIVASAPGSTTVRLSTGRTKTITQGDTVEIATAAGPQSPSIGPFAIRTDKPAEAILVAGQYMQSTVSSGNYVDARTWATSLAEMTPRERWVSFSRFRAPALRPGMEHSITVVGDSGIRAWVDGNAIVFRTHRSGLGEFRYAEVPLDTGDHELRTGGGLAGGIVHGRVRGYEAYKPPTAKQPDAGSSLARASAGTGADAGSMPLHPSTYIEEMAFSYAYPIVGLTMTDSLAIQTDRTCDSTVVSIEHAPGPFAGQNLSYRREPGATNTSVTITPRMSGTIVSGYRIRFAPVDRRRSASMTISVLSASGIIWPITFTHDPEFIDVAPRPVYFSNAPVGTRLTASARVTNSGAGEVTITRVSMRDGNQGFTVSADLPAIIGPGETLPLAVSFIGSAGLRTYRDSIIVETCGLTTSPVVAVTREVISDPSPTIDSVDWHERWLSTLNDCTKSPTDNYDSVITIANMGSTPYVVAALELVGDDADAGFFALDGSDLTLVVRPGDTIAPASEQGRVYRQRVLFRPRDERAYSCLVRLETTDGAVVYGELRGIGIESHIVVEPDPVDAGTVGFAGGLAAARCTATVRALPTRSLHVQDLTIGGVDAASFAFDATGGFQAPRLADPSTWWTLAPGEEREVPLLFMPSDTGRAEATLVAIGDHSRCDDSTVALIGRAIVPVEVGSVGEIVHSACGDTTIMLMIFNRSTAPVTLTNIEIAPDDELSVWPAVTLPLSIEGGDSLALPLRYAPMAIGARAATIDLEIGDATASETLQRLIVSVPTKAWGDSMAARVMVQGAMSIGGSTIVQLVLDEPAGATETGALRLAVGWNPKALYLRGLSLDGTLLDGWSVTVDRHTGDTLEATLTPNGAVKLDRAGALAALDFVAFLSSDTASGIYATLTPVARPCLAIRVEPGRAHLDSICGLANRLVELFPDVMSKVTAAPNPFDATTTIAFGMPLPAHARLEVIDALGRVVAVLVDEALDAGVHTRTWIPDTWGTGLYQL
jgi:hypothetical protein